RLPRALRERVEPGAASADVSRDGDACAAAEHPDERRAAVEERARAIDLEGEQSFVRLARELPWDHTEAVEAVRRQVDASALVVLVHVLPVLEQLQRRADVVGAGDAIRRRDAEH